MKIALIEDDEFLSATIVEYLNSNGYLVESYTSGLKFIENIKFSNIDLIILDLFIHDMNGLEVLEHLQKIDSKVPVFILSGIFEIDYIEKAFSLGVKDYIKKPVHLKEILIRIKTHLDQNDEVVLAEGVVFDKSKKLLFQNNQEVTLNPKQKELLSVFVRYPNEILTYEFLISSVWGYSEVAVNTIATYVRDLKSSISPATIVNISKIGYKLQLLKNT